MSVADAMFSGSTEMRRPLSELDNVPFRNLKLLTSIASIHGSCDRSVPDVCPALTSRNQSYHSPQLHELTKKQQQHCVPLGHLKVVYPGENSPCRELPYRRDGATLCNQVESCKKQACFLTSDHGSARTRPARLKGVTSCRSLVKPPCRISLLKRSRAPQVCANDVQSFRSPAVCVTSVSTGVSRKDKSLSVLCNRFIELFPLDVKIRDGVTLLLDATAAKLNTERRRIYDIVNILESIGYAFKVEKNVYQWVGRRNLSATLLSLYNSGLQTTLSESVEHALRQQTTVDNCGALSYNETNAANGSDHRRIGEKTLGKLAQKFLTIFLVSGQVNLSQRVVIMALFGIATSGGVSGNDSCQRTRIRRLYDVANILSSVGLVQRQVDEACRQTVYRYTGPPVVNAAHTSCSSQVTSTVPKAQTQTSGARAPSLDDICRVTARERYQLFEAPCCINSDSSGELTVDTASERMYTAATAESATKLQAALPEQKAAFCLVDRDCYYSPALSLTKQRHLSSASLTPSCQMISTPDSLVTPDTMKLIREVISSGTIKLVCGMDITPDQSRHSALTRSSGKTSGATARRKPLSKAIRRLKMD